MQVPAVTNINFFPNNIHMLPKRNGYESLLNKMITEGKIF